MIFTIFAPRKRPYRLPPAGYRVTGYRPTSKAIGPILNVEKNEMDRKRKEKRG